MLRQRSATPQTTRAILVALVLLLATLAAQLRVTRCAADCCQGTAAAAGAQSCCADDAVGVATACCCCGHSAGGAAQLDAACGSHADGGRTRVPGPPAQRASCRLGCMAPMAFAGVDFAPAPAGVQLPAHPPAATAPRARGFAAALAEPLARGRPFDRGPPRLDARAGLRAATVLLL